jgi:hypothetical protein
MPRSTKILSRCRDEANARNHSGFEYMRLPIDEAQPWRRVPDGGGLASGRAVELGLWQKADLLVFGTAEHRAHAGCSAARQLEEGESRDRKRPRRSSRSSSVRAVRDASWRNEQSACCVAVASDHFRRFPRRSAGRHVAENTGGGTLQVVQLDGECIWYFRRNRTPVVGQFAGISPTFVDRPVRLRRYSLARFQDVDTATPICK